MDSMDSMDWMDINASRTAQVPMAFSNSSRAATTVAP